jgi:hypothetical protein
LKKFGILLLTLSIGQLSFAKSAIQLALETPTEVEINLNEVCPGAELRVEMSEEESQLCETLELLRKQKSNQPIVIEKRDRLGKPWKIRFYFGPTLAKYSATNIRLQSDHYDVEIEGVTPEQRTSMDFYKVWDYPVKDMLRWIDEPTNTFIITFEKGPHEIGLHVFHPKYVMLNLHTGTNVNETYRVRGEINGQQVDREMPLGVYHEDFEQGGSQLLFHRYENSHRHMNFNLRYAYSMPLLKKNRFGNLKYTAGATIGILTGFSNSVYSDNNNYWRWHQDEEKNGGIMGAGGGILQRLQWTNKKDKFGLFFEYQHNFYKMKYRLAHGTAKHNLRYQTFTMGINVRLAKQKKKPTPSVNF